MSKANSPTGRHTSHPNVGTHTIARLPTAQAESGYSRSTIYLRMSQGLWTKQIRLGPRCIGWPASDIASIKAPTLVVVGDQDVVTPEHAIEMLRLLGGGVPGDIGKPVPEDQLAILPNTTHIGMLSTSAEKLAQLTRGRDFEPFDRSLDVQISRLRKMIEPDPAQPRYIQTVWGVGYVFVPDGTS